MIGVEDDAQIDAARQTGDNGADRPLYKELAAFRDVYARQGDLLDGDMVLVNRAHLEDLLERYETVAADGEGYVSPEDHEDAVIIRDPERGHENIFYTATEDENGNNLGEDWVDLRIEERVMKQTDDPIVLLQEYTEEELNYPDVNEYIF